MSLQIINQGDKPEWVVVPYEDYLQVLHIRNFCSIFKIS
jgi:hypothetical protein